MQSGACHAMEYICYGQEIINDIIPSVKSMVLISQIISQEADKNDTTTNENANAPTPLPLDELAPAPNMDDIFGK